MKVPAVMNSKLLRISISYDSEKNEPVHVKVTDNATGHREEVRGTLDGIRKDVLQVLERWLQEGRGALTSEACEYYATYIDYEARRRATESPAD